MIDDDEKIITNNIINTMPYNIYTALKNRRKIEERKKLIIKEKTKKSIFIIIIMYLYY